jgi:hypothetical protein
VPEPKDQSAMRENSLLIERINDKVLTYSTGNYDVVYNGAYLRIRIREGAEFSYEKCAKDREETKQLLGNKKVPFLIDANFNFTVTAEGMDLAASAEGTYNRSAVAYFTDNLASRLRLKVFIASRKPVVPSAIFKSEQEAIAWLRSIDLGLS